MAKKMKKINFGEIEFMDGTLWGLFGIFRCN